jgi:hypothetical protein
MFEDTLNQTDDEIIQDVYLAADEAHTSMGKYHKDNSRSTRHRMKKFKNPSMLLNSICLLFTIYQNG